MSKWKQGAGTPEGDTGLHLLAGAACIAQCSKELEQQAMLLLLPAAGVSSDFVWLPCRKMQSWSSTSRGNKTTPPSLTSSCQRRSSSTVQPRCSSSCSRSVACIMIIQPVGSRLHGCICGSASSCDHLPAWQHGCLMSIVAGFTQYTDEVAGSWHACIRGAVTCCICRSHGGKC